MKHIYYMLVALLLVSCDFTDIKQKGETLPDDNIYSLLGLINNTSGTRSEQFAIYLLPEFQLPEDFIIEPESQLQDRFYNWEAQPYAPDQENSDIAGVWNKVNEYNIVLAYVDGYEGYEAEKAQIKSSALIRRAHAYLLYLTHYCQLYTEENKDTPGLGWINKYTEYYDGTYERMTLNESYTKVIEDLELALEQNVAKSKETIYGCNATAHAMLGMTYMTMNKYDKALTHLEAALTDYKYLHNYADIKDVEGNVDVMVLMKSEHYTDPELYMPRGSWNFDFRYSVDTGNKIFPNQTFINLFEGNDLRKGFLVEYEGNVHWTNFQGDNISYDCSVPLVVLLKAEILARKGEAFKDDAMDVLNDFRAYRFAEGADYELEADNSEQAIQYVMEEATRELGFSNHHFVNVKRWNAYHNAGIKVERKNNITGDMFTVEANDPRWLLPLPEKTLEESPGMTQNPR